MSIIENNLSVFKSASDHVDVITTILDYLYTVSVKVTFDSELDIYNNSYNTTITICRQFFVSFFIFYIIYIKNDNNDILDRLIQNSSFLYIFLDKLCTANDISIIYMMFIICEDLEIPLFLREALM